MTWRHSTPLSKHFTCPRITEEGVYRTARVILIGIGLLALLTIPAFIGLIIPFIGVRFAFLLGAGLAGLSMLFIPAPWVLYIAFVLIFALLGPIKYFGSIDPQWAGYILGAVMFIRALMEAAARSGQQSRIVLGWSAGYFVSVFLTVVVFSTVVAPPSAYLALIGIRGFILLWGFFFLIAVTDLLPADAFRKIAFIMVIIGLFQIPLALYQRIFVASGSVLYSNAPWDAVVGSFDGYRQFGGDSGGMGIFMVAMIGAVLIFWRRKLLSTHKMLLLVPLYCIPILVAEVKVVYILIPAMVSLVFASHFRKNLPVAILALFLTAAGLYGLDKTYSTLNVTGIQRTYANRTLEDSLKTIFSFSVDTNVYSSANSEMGRVTALVFWADQHSPISNPKAFFIGDGLGANSGGKVEENSQYSAATRQFNYANSSAAVLLWNFGVIGFALYVGMMVALFLELRKLSKLEIVPNFHRSLLEAGSVYVSLLILTLAYNEGLFGQSQPSLLIFVALMGYAVFWKNQLRKWSLGTMTPASPPGNRG